MGAKHSAWSLMPGNHQIQFMVHIAGVAEMSLLIREQSISTAKNQMLNDTATLSLVLLPLATPNLTREMLPESRSCPLGQLHVHATFLGSGFFYLGVLSFGVNQVYVVVAVLCAVG